MIELKLYFHQHHAQLSTKRHRDVIHDGARSVGFSMLRHSHEPCGRFTSRRVRPSTSEHGAQATLHKTMHMSERLETNPEQMGTDGDAWGSVRCRLMAAG